MSNARKVFAVAVLAALAWAVAPGAEAQPPIRIGVSLAQTGAYATLSQVQLRGYQLCVKYMNADLSFHSAGGYGGCQVLVEAIRCGSLDSEKLREAILKLAGPHGRIARPYSFDLII